MTEPQRTCPSCGNEFSGAMEFCPVCVLRKALAVGVESGASSASEDPVEPKTPERAVQRFEHYELVTGSSWPKNTMPNTSLDITDGLGDRPSSKTSICQVPSQLRSWHVIVLADESRISHRRCDYELS